MRRFLSSLLIILMIANLSFTVSANEPEVLSDGIFSYYINDKSAVITSCNVDRTVITIPKTLGGYTVTKIEDGAFSLCEKLEYFRSVNKNFSVSEGVLYTSEDKTLICYPQEKNVSIYHIPGYIKQIAPCAFIGNEYINKVYFNKNITYVPAECFAGCVNLNTVSLDDNTTHISDGAFAFCSSLKQIDLPSELSSIGSAAFYGCSNLNSLKLTDKVFEIGEMAFKDCISIKEIYIPSSIYNVSDWLFSISPKMEKVSVGRDNEIYTVVDGILYTKNKDILVFCPPALKKSELSVPDSVIIIGRNSFENHKTLKKITIPDSVTTIEANAFYNATELEEVSFGISIESIGDFAFFGCNNIDKITITSSVKSIGNGTFENCKSISLSVAEGSVAHSYAVAHSVPFEIDPNQPTVPKTYWADKYIAWSEENGITFDVSDYKTALTRQGFCHIIVNFYEKYLKKRAKVPENPFTDTDSTAILKAYELGFVNGMGNGKFCPANSITRQELCITICNVLTVLNGEPPEKGDTVVFRDQEKIASWANDYVITAYNNDIISGRSDGRIDPTGTASIEEALAMLYNMLPLIEK